MNEGDELDEQKPKHKQKQSKGGDADQKTQKEVKKESPDFKYIVRIANTDIDGKKKVDYAISSIRGIGIRAAQAIIEHVGIASNEKIGNLSNENIEKISEAIQHFSEYVPPWLNNRPYDYKTGKSQHIYSNDLVMSLRDDINLMRKIRCYKGIRHENHQKVRGQRTRSNGREGVAVGVARQKQAAQQTTTTKEEPKK